MKGTDIMSVKYSFLKGAFRLVGTQKIMAQPYDELMKFFKTSKKPPDIPKLSDNTLDIKKFKINESHVLYFKHKKPNDRVCIYITGGGMLKYPKPAQARALIDLSKKIDRDVIFPYYPLCPEHTLLDVYDMLYKLYKKLLPQYSAENILLLGGSSGGNLAFGLVSYINAQGENLPKPGKIYASSPGTMLITDEEKERAATLNKTDVVMSTSALETIFDGMAGGKHVPNYMKYLQCGNYSGLKSSYLCFGGDEIFSAAAYSIKDSLEKYGVDVTLEIGKGLYHCYSVMPLVQEAQQGYENMIQYCKCRN